MKPRPSTRARVLAIVALVTGAAAASLASACSDGDGPASPCTEIPAGGCPLSRGVACEDPSCEAVYACRPGNVWELAEQCPSRDGGAAREGGIPPDADAPAPFDAAVDAPPGAFGGPGCTPLVAPECALGMALACGAGGCCGCEELFVCANGGWDLWGTCGDGGPVHDPAR